MPRGCRDFAVVYEEGEDADDYSAFLPRTLEAVGGGGIRDNTIVSLNDFSQVPAVLPGCRACSGVAVRVAVVSTA